MGNTAMGGLPPCGHWWGASGSGRPHPGGYGAKNNAGERSKVIGSRAGGLVVTRGGGRGAPSRPPSATGAAPGRPRDPGAHWDRSAPDPRGGARMTWGRKYKRCMASGPKRMVGGQPHHLHTENVGKYGSKYPEVKGSGGHTNMGAAILSLTCPLWSAQGRWCRFRPRAPPARGDYVIKESN